MERLVKVYVIENDAGLEPFIVGERRAKLSWNKHRYQRQIFITKKFAKRIIKCYRDNRMIQEFCRVELY